MVKALIFVKIFLAHVAHGFGVMYGCYEKVAAPLKFSLSALV